MNDREWLWKEIQSRDPALAKLLTKVKQVFGKPESLNVRFNQQEKT